MGFKRIIAGIILLTGLFCPYVVKAQTAPISITANVAGVSGQAIVNFVAAPLAPVSTLNFDVTMPASGLAFVSVANGALLTVGKNTSASIIPGTPDKLRVLVFGLNATPIVSGEIVKINFTGIAGTYPLPVVGIVLSSPAATIVPSLGANGNLVIP